MLIWAAGHVDRGHNMFSMCLLSFCTLQNSGTLKNITVNFTVDFKATQHVNLLPFSTCRGNRINNEHLYRYNALKLKVLLCILFQVKIFSPCVCLEVELYRQLLLSEIQKSKKDCTEYFERQSIHNKVEKSHPHTKKTPNQMNFDHY